LLIIVDECEEGSRSELLDQLQHLLCDAATTRRVKIIITSRPHIPVASHLTNVNTLHLVAKNLHSDIKAFVKAEVGKLPQFSGSLGEEVQQTLIEDAKGMFLWVSLILEDLKTSTDTTPHAIRKSLKSLPPDLSGVYMNILRNIQAKDHKTAQSILQWVVWAVRPLTLQELTIAIAMRPKYTSMSSIQDYMQTNMKNVLRLIFGPMLRIEDSDTVHLVHQSAKDFLIGMNISTGVGVHSYSLPIFVTSPTKCNMQLAVSCLSYLCIDECEVGPVTGEYRWNSDVRQNIKILQHKLEFLDYAATHWPEHAKQADRSDDKTIFLSFKKLAMCPQKMNLAYQIFTFSRRRGFKKTPPLQIAASMGLLAFVKQLLDDGANINVQGGTYGNALQAAVFNGHTDMVCLLCTRSDIEITEPIVKAIAGYTNRGKEVMDKLLSAHPEITITKPIVTAAAGNSDSGKEVIEALLSARPNIQITEPTVTAAAGNTESGKEVIEALLSARPDIQITEPTVTAAAGNTDSGKEVIEALLSASPDIQITEPTVTAAAGNTESGKEVIEALLSASPDIQITEPTVTAAAGNTDSGKDVIEALLSARPDIQITEPTITAAAGNTGSGKEVIEALLSARPDIQITEPTFKAAAGNRRRGREVMELLLTARPDIEITEPIIIAAKGNSRGKEVMKELLSARPDIQITEMAVAAIAENFDKEVIKLLLSARPNIQITKPIIIAAKGNPRGKEVMEKLLSARPDIQITEMAVAAIAKYFDKEVIKLLLCACPDIEITEPIIIAAERNPRGKEVMEELLSTRPDIEITEMAVGAIAGNFGKEVIKLLLSVRPNIQITERTVTAAARNWRCDGEVMELLLSASPDIKITMPIVTAAAGNMNSGKKVMEVLLSACPDIRITELMIAAAAGDWRSGRKMMEMLLSARSDIEITEPIITAVAKNEECGLAVMTMLLSARPDIKITEPTIAAAAGNWGSAKEVMEVLLSARLEINITEPIITASAGNDRGGMEVMSILLNRVRQYGIHLASVQAAAYFGMLDCTKSLLMKCSPSTLNEKYTQLVHAAVESGVADILKLVLEFGGNDSSLDDHNWTTYMTAFQSRNAWALQRFADTAQQPSSSVFPPKKWVSAHACVSLPLQVNGTELLYSGNDQARTLTRKLTWRRYIKEYAVFCEKRPSLSAWKSWHQLF